MTGYHAKDSSAFSPTSRQLPPINKRSSFTTKRTSSTPQTACLGCAVTADDSERGSKHDQSHIPQEIQDSLTITGHKYYCTLCAVGFAKQKNYHEHINGKKHLRVESERASAWEDFLADAPSWESCANEQADVDTAIVLDVHTSWRDSEFSDYPHGQSCMDPAFTLDTISPHLRARFWRYLRDSFGKHYPELASIFHHVSLSSPRYLRVKELFETLEAFKIVSGIIVMAQDKNHSNNIGQEKGTTIDTIYDLACGHGLLGILLAYRFPTKKIICVDLEARDSFEAFRAAFNEMGDTYKGQTTPLSNLEYREADLLSIQLELERNQGEPTTSFLIALHACNEANIEVVGMAKNAGAMWAVMPCCIRSKLYLNGAPVLDLDNNSRYNLLCGAFAEANDAQLVRGISRHITARPIVIAGGVFPQCKDTKYGSSTATTRKIRKGGRGTMPPL